MDKTTSTVTKSRFDLVIVWAVTGIVLLAVTLRLEPGS
jgi:hypothetical protein